MSLITQCPACSTMFKVVPDQLRVSEGWVRCGQCDEVFDANAHLQSAGVLTSSAPVAPAQEQAPSSSPSPVVPPATQAPASDGYDWGPVTGMTAPEPISAQALPQASVDVVQPSPELGAAAVAEEEVDDGAPLRDPFLEKSPQELSSFEVAAPVDLDVDLGNELPPRHEHTEQQAVAAQSTPSFLAKPSRPAREASGWSLGLMVVGCVSLLLALVAQLLVHERDHIAATRPALAPAIESLCTLAGCEIAALRNIDAVVIDSSSFAKAGAQTYKLQFTVKNVAAMTVATPALELTLTDTQDRALVRRVVKPDEFGSLKGTLNAGDELSATLPIQVRPSKETEKIAGYRLLAFYP